MQRSTINRPAQQGIALIASLFIASFLLALTGAFMAVNQSHFAILRNNEDRTRARRAAQAGLEYAFYSLEHDRRWGKPDLGEIPARGSGTVATGHGDFEVKRTDGQEIYAYYKPLKADLVITVENNLSAAPVSLNQAVEELSNGTVPSEHVKITVVASAGGAQYDAMAILRLAPLYEDTMYANGEIAVDASESFLSASTDPFRNSIKATGDVYLPEVDQGKTRFTKEDGITPDSTGLLQANGVVYNRYKSGTTVVDNRLTSTDITKTGGRVLEEVQRKFSFFELDPTDLPVAGEASQVPVTIGSGEYRFTRSRAVASFRVEEGGLMGGSTVTTNTADIDVLEYYENPGDETPTKIFRSYRRLNDSSSGTHITHSTIFQYSNGETVAETDANFVEAKIASLVALDGGVPRAISPSERGNYRVVIDLDRQSFDVSPGTQVVPAKAGGDTSEGTLQITNKPGIYAQTEGAAFHTPTLNLGSSGKDVSIRAARDVELSNAFTKGVGTIVSEKGDISLRPLADGTFDVSSPSEGLALYAKNDVTVSNPGKANWNFNGFVFAGDDFNFDANPHGTEERYDVSFRGSVVATNRNRGDTDSVNGISIDHARNVKLWYDPEYLKFLTRNLQGPEGPSNDIALECLYKKI